MGRMRLKTFLKYHDYPLIIAVMLLSLFGLIMVYSASMITAVVRFHTASDYFFQKQKWAWIIGACMFLFTAFVPYKHYARKKFLQFVFFVMPLPLIYVLLFGHTANNATSWIKLGPVNVQPAEFAKIGLIVYLSGVLANKQKKLQTSPQEVLFPIYYMLFICLLVFLQPDAGTMLIIVAICLTIILSSATSKWLLIKQGVLFGIVFLLSLPFIYDKVFTEVRKARLYSFLDPFAYAQKEGYQLINSYFAIANGGLKGLGLGQGIQKYGYLPEAHTDFIMAVIAEELGLFGVSFVLILLSFIVLRGFVIARRCPDAFGSLLAIGISAMIGIQASINLGGVTGIIPLTGVPLPFVSYGGSSLVLLMMSVGVLANISAVANYEKYKTEKQNNIQKNHVSFS
ncbi:MULTISPECIES: FtsW/RodA/SpoVE family cell cycle protein [Anoxybacillus]|uniref:Probable peptidoglycan glycosyltransferase FtsW n=2 Tax=Anoxybacillus flavithermus TaxID=33934 RepID=A0AAX2A407_9BACL|nr:FtsW/RodA/SpoVE family cell cycle protein [Anoxybacillus flavithermus]ELK21433.1 cell cycle family protein [Anoxybacillus flavithermus TNO-09.006]MBE2903945.1 FtsW/RodA/SpoVE family cell cycle protein [Anoxybacillus flavithermus]MBE2918446.1 FtsW/RodA/SpoVE family cell cycle protein [Anoxybacillus flavithermus]MBE2920439.1 FtsW/RodA/SpoVE family cell cycle protein [Anoxybacillus flavithermus]MBE2924413.1 FtsW/RodA/SpoVE family cell cycle protein [Anoxybacillus flavithermus]